MSGKARMRVATILVVLVSALIGFWQPGAASRFWDGLEGQLLDLRFMARGPLAPPSGVAVIAIDDADLAALGQFPLPRAALARAVETATRGGAAAIALDLLLVDPTADDDVLAAALARGPRTVLGVAGMEGAGVSADIDAALGRSGFDVVIDIPASAPVAVLAPVPALARAATRLGHVNFAPAADGALRRFPAALPLATGGAVIWVPNLALAAVAVLTEDAPTVLRQTPSGQGGAVTTGSLTTPLDSEGAVPVIYYGPEGTVATWSLADMEKADLAGRIVFIGITALGVSDRHPSPFDVSLPGVEAQATLAANLLEGRYLRRDGTAWIIDIVLAQMLGLAMLRAAARERPGAAAGTVVVVVIVACAVLQAAFQAGWWLDGVTAVLVGTTGGAVGAVLRLSLHRARASNLARYQSPLMVETLASAAEPFGTGKTSQAAVLFVDIAAFTAHSEAAAPDLVAVLLRRFHDVVGSVAARHGGVVDNFMGDGVLVVFGMPAPAPDDADRALGCAADLCGAAERFDDDALTVRIGAHCGPAHVGPAGSAQQRRVTVAGDMVNVASRLQAVASEANLTLVVSDTLLQQSGRALDWTRTLALRDLGLRTLRGRSRPLHVWGG